MKKHLSDISFLNRFTEHLPGDLSFDKTPRFTPDVCYSLVEPTPVPDPKLIGFSEDLATQLGLAYPNAEDLKLLSGSALPKDSKPFALCYAGHQFGHWAGQLGDGRAITLGDMDDVKGRKWEIQLKGSGLTPYSRTADGKAVLRSSLREFLASEAMFYLGVPTTRALSLVTTGESVMRDMFYTGDIQSEPGAIVSRLAPTFLRFGNFEMLAAQSNTDLLLKLIDWSVQFHFPQYKDLEPAQKVSAWFKEICEKTAFLMTEWLRVGFVHGVMNTDNMSILGLTIDYGPYGWLEEYDPSWTPNTTDLPGRRYCFGRQAPIAFWNLQALASALDTLGDVSKGMEEGLNHYQKSFEKNFFEMMTKKLGLKDLGFEKDQEFLREFDEILQLLRADMTLFYRNLNDWHPDLTEEKKEGWIQRSYELCYSEPNQETQLRFKNWLNQYSERIKKSGESLESRRSQMNQVNPKYVLRNYMAYQMSQAIEKENDLTLFNEIFEVLKKPYEEQPQFERWASMRPDWAKDQPGSSTLSCSS